MAIREITAPVTARSRKSKYPFSEAEVKQASDMLGKGKTPGVGPYEGDTALREARSAGQSLVRHITTAQPDLAGQIGTKAWETDEGAFCILKLKTE